jgi:type III pantothenate kinase
MLATIDISNTRVTTGLFDGAEMRAHFAAAADARRTADEYALLLSAFLREEGIPRGDVRGAAIASVVPALTGVFEQVCSRVLRVRPLVVGDAARIGIRLATRNPREVGADRIVNAIAVQHLHGSPAIVVDLDTATAFDIVAPDGSYAGSVIAPGLALSAEALAQHTSRLQRVQLSKPTTIVGKDTIGAIQSGLIYGHIALIEGLVERIRSEIAQPTAVVVATGELAPLLAVETRCIDRIEPWLSLIGLRLFYERNQEAG